MENARILIVEDEVLVAHDLKMTLERFGYSVPAIACSASEAVEMIRETRPDLVLMDIVIKGEEDGIDVATAIREEMEVPVIYLTAYSDEATLERAKPTEPFGYIIKPFKERELNSAIEIALYKHDVERRLAHLNTVLRAIRSVSQLIYIETDRGRLLRGICDRLVATRGYETAWIALHDASGNLIPEAQAGLEEDWFFSLREWIERGDTIRCYDSGGEVCRSSAVVIESPITQCGTCPLVVSFKNPARRDRGVMSVSIEFGSNIYGRLTVSTQARYVGDADECDLLAEVAGDIALALRSIEAEEETQRVEADRDRILDCSHDFIYVVAMDGYPKYVNPAWQRLGYSEGKLLSRSLLNFVHPDDQGRTAAELEKLAKGGAAAEFENRLVHRDGSVMTFSWKALAIPEEDAIYAFGRDITEQKRIEERERESRVPFERLFENAVGGTVICRLIADEEGRPTDLELLQGNRALEKHTGLTAQHIVGKRASELAAAEELGDIIDAYEQVVATSEPRSFARYFSTLDRTLDVTVIHLGGDLLALSFVDVTER